ncbi:MAG: hypothetical protein HYX27_14810 [Acidobacteria bacterium]|nr:hypothetical protein [Acidobacteriota bacterium]
MRLLTLIAVFLFIAQAEDMGVVRKLADNKLAGMPGMPACVTMAVENGDSSKGPSTIVFKAASRCTIPWHWHTPNEQLMMVKGSAKLEMKGGTATVVGPGGYAMLPSKHAHQFTCVSACTAFVHSDGPFDIHYVDADGKEITPDAALGTKKKPS